MCAHSLKRKLQLIGIKVDLLETYTVNTLSSNILYEIIKKVKKIIYNVFKLITLVKVNRNNTIYPILHCHIGSGISFWENSLYAYVARVMKVPIIFHVHSSLILKEYKSSNPIMRIFRKYILTKTSSIIALSNYWKKQLLKIEGISSEKITILPNFVDVLRFKDKNKMLCKDILQLPKNKIILITIGRLEPEKGHKFLLEAIQRIINAKKDILCVIVGDGTLRKYLEEYAKSLGIDEYVVFAGLQPPNKIPCWLVASDIFVLPSLRENFPVVMLEALASGLPFVGSSVGAIPEVIVSDNYGLLVTPADVDDLANKLILALNRHWNKKIIQKYAEKFTWGSISNKLLNIYWGVINDK